MFATIARGSHYVMEAEFYADLTDTGAKESDLKLLSAAANTTQNDENAHKDNDIHPDVSDNINTYMYDSEDPWQQQLSHLKESLNEITSDIISRLEETNHNILSGVTKFIRTYNTMKESHSPTTTITYALHNFGRPDSEFSLLLIWPITNCFIHFISQGFVKARGRIGRYIKTNSSGIQRRRKGLPRGTKRAPQGRPTKRPLNEPNYLPPKAKRQKKPHCLSLNIQAKGQLPQNEPS